MVWPTSWEGIAIGGNLRLNVLQGQQRSIPGASGTSGTDRSTKAGLLSFRGDFSEYWVRRGKLFPKIGILKLGSLNSHVRHSRARSKLRPACDALTRAALSVAKPRSTRIRDAHHDATLNKPVDFGRQVHWPLTCIGGRFSVLDCHETPSPNQQPSLNLFSSQLGFDGRNL